MKRLLASLAASAASALAVPMHSVFSFDLVRSALRGVSIAAAVLGGSIYPDIDPVHSVETGTYNEPTAHGRPAGPRSSTTALGTAPPCRSTAGRPSASLPP